MKVKMANIDALMLKYLDWALLAYLIQKKQY